MECFRNQWVYDGQDKEKGVFKIDIPEKHILMSVALFKVIAWGGSPPFLAQNYAEPFLKLPSELVYKPHKKIITLWLYLIKFHKGNRKSKVKQMGYGFAHP